MKLSTQIISQIQRKTKSLKYIPLVDGIRFLAISLVIFQHLNERMMKYNHGMSLSALEEQISFYISRGTIGVFIFFVLSGFVIAMPFAKRTITQKFSYLDYIKRRLTRLEPPYIIWMFIFSVVLFLSSDLSLANLVKHYLASVFYVHQFVYGEFSIINPVAWSLEVELQFYLLAPFLCVFYFSIPSFRNRIALIAAVILSWISVQHLFDWHLLPHRASILGFLQFFLLGILLADLYKNSSLLSTKKNVIWDILVLVALYVMAITWTEEYLKTLVFLVATFLLFISLFRGKIINGILSKPLIAGIGGMCYTIYLIHLPLMEGITKLVYSYVSPSSYIFNLTLMHLFVIPIILIISTLGYILLEKPFMTGNEVFVRFNEFYRSIKKNRLVQLRFKFLIKAAMLIGLLLIGLQTKAQINDDAFQLSQDKILPLDDLIAMAERNSMQVKSISANQKQIEEEIKALKKNWMDHIFLTANVNYGSSNISDQLYTSNNIGETYTSRQNTLYNVGVNIFLPVSRVTTKGNQVKSQKHKIESLEYLKYHQLLELREEVIKYYKELIFNMKTIGLNAEKAEVNRAAMELTEAYYKSGQTEMKQYQSALDAYFSAKIEFEKSKNETFYCLHMLEELVGSSIMRP
jgi:peptidoglycan/LPS O-acetylase OafA/YrhL